MKAIRYQRISDKDQSNFSISGQGDIIATYCSKNNIEIVNTFIDEGESAKNFDRPDWKELEQFVKTNHAAVDLLIVAKFDRFSRNIAEALQMIEMLENRYHIRVISAMEPISMHPSSPYYFQIRSQILLSGNVELLIIKDRTKFGMHHALKAGRYVSKAPIGYTNSRDATNKPLIIINPPKAELIKQVYDRFLSGQNIETIRRAMKESGLVIAGNSGVQEILQNPVYMGYVKVPAYYEDPGGMVKAIHEPIIEESKWWQANGMLNRKITRHSASAEFPLRGVLRCYCGRNITAANSKGRRQYFGYYKCNHHTGANFSSKKLHAQMDELLKELSLPKFHIEYLQQKIVDNINNELKQAQGRIMEQQQQLSEIEKKIDNLEEKFFSNDIDRPTFTKWKMRYHTDQQIIQQRLADLRRPGSETLEQYSATIGRLSDLHWLYHQGTTEQQQAFVRLVFNSQLYYQHSSYRTPWILPVFAAKEQTLKEKGLLIIDHQTSKADELKECAPHRTIIEHLPAFLQLISTIKVA